MSQKKKRMANKETKFAYTKSPSQNNSDITLALLINRFSLFFNLEMISYIYLQRPNTDFVFVLTQPKKESKR